MCGIAGFLGPFEPSLLKSMSDAVSHRGPDDQGELYRAGDRLGLAHRRLSIIDLSPSGHQPMADLQGRAIVVFNGEIYNYRELRQELVQKGFQFAGTSDTEVLLNAYLAYGLDLLQHMNGIFAFALWDATSRRLLLARDGMGVKPLYYAETAGGVVFASELKALLQVPGLDRSLDLEAIGHYVNLLYAPSPLTPLRAVRKLEPGEAVLYDRQGKRLRAWKHYRLPYDQPIAEIRDEDASEELVRLLKQAVKRQMVADVPVGAFLSGGLDSSSICAFARETSTNLPCFTIEFSDSGMLAEGMQEDLPYAGRTAEYLKIPLESVKVGPEMAGDLQCLPWLLDEPQADPAALNTLYLSSLAKQRGIKVLLSGCGGDDLFSGYRRHDALMLERLWSWWPHPLRSAVSRIAGRFPVRNASLRRLRKILSRAAARPDERLAEYYIWLEPAKWNMIKGPAFMDATGIRGSGDVLLAALADLPAGQPPLNRMLFLDTRYFLADHNLAYTDKMSMAAGVEVRVPFLDPDVVSFAARLPLHFKHRHGTGKWILRKAMAPYLPDAIIRRPKTGFGAPVRKWLHHEWRPLVDDCLGAKPLRDRGLFDPDGVQCLISLDREGRCDASYSILAMLCIELWCRKFLKL